MKKRWLIPAALAGAAAMIASGAFAATNAGTFNMAAGSHLAMTCPNALSNTGVAADSETVDCAANPTTTTTVAPTTTTTPVVTTTVPPPPPPPPPSGNCGLSVPALCETFDQPATNPPSNTRSGQLNGVLWGTAETTGNQSSGGLSPAIGACGGSSVYYPDNIQICNGQAVDTIQDGDTVTSLGMYPRQPFDFANRTGTIAFDLSNDTQGGHAAWPELWVSDQPVPDPWTFNGSWFALPRNGFGIQLAGCVDGNGNAATCPEGDNSVGVSSVNIVSNYTLASGFTLSGDDSIIKSGPGQMNHYQISVSQSTIQVWGTDAFTPGQPMPALKHIATVSNANLSFTRGLVWVEDEHYSACKFNTQCLHSFAWDNIGFDGPVLPRDLGFDVPNMPGPDEEYQVPANGSLPVTIPAVTNINLASGALFEFNLSTDQPIPLQVAINGHDISMPWPFPSGASSMETIAMPVPLADLVAGDNTAVFTAGNYRWSIANIDLILQGAGG